MIQITINEPIPFPGTREELDANFASHSWDSFDGMDGHCFNCDCKPWHIMAQYPCGTIPPRHYVTYNVEAPNDNP